MGSKTSRGYFLLSYGTELLQSNPTVDGSWSSLALRLCPTVWRSYCHSQLYISPTYHSRKFYAVDSIKLPGKISKLPFAIIDFSLFLFNPSLLPSQRRQCPKAVSVLIFVILLAEEQCFSLSSAFLIIDTLWYGEGLASALAFWFFSFGPRATPGCIYDNRLHNGQIFHHQPVRQRVCSKTCRRSVAWEEKREMFALYYWLWLKVSLFKDF